MKRVFSALLCTVLVISSLSIQAFAQDIPQKTQEEALKWARDQVGKVLDYDNLEGAQCVDLIKAYYAFLGFEPHSGSAKDYASEAALRPGMQLLPNAQPEPGDILIYTNAPNGHVAIYESDRVHYEQNVKGYTGVATPDWDYRAGGSYWGVIRPAWKFIPGVPNVGTVSPEIVVPTCTWSGYSARHSISETEPEATLAATLRVSGSAKITDVTHIGIQLFDASGNQVTGKEEDHINFSGDRIEMWYDVSKDLGYHMIGGVEYQYVFYADIKVGDGIIRMESGRERFTAGQSASPAPTVHNTHSMLYIEAQPATQSTPGVRQHWYCIDCQKNFLDEDGNWEASQAQLTIPQLTQPAAPQVTFLDVAAGEYYFDAVAWADARQIAAGTSPHSFSPNAPCTRAETVTFLWRAMGSPKVYERNPFQDVAPGTYYYDAMLWAVSQGIVAGTDVYYFSPNAPCTRAQAITFLYRAQSSPYGSGNCFSDVDDTAWYAQAVSWAAFQGITNGTGTYTFSPNATCTRGQIITFLYRALV